MRTLLTILVLTLLPTRIDVPPVSPVRVVAPFRAPVDEYAAGHRGVDLAARPGQLVVSPITGTITFQGVVAGRAVIVISDGRRSASLEPVTSSLDEGAFVRAGQNLGTVANGGHCTLRCVHLGLRLDGRYVNPFGVRARLVP